MEIVYFYIMVSIHNKKFIVYKSSAGSGKTFTLVREYLSIVLQNPESFRQVLAITFTNKAANEMKERVVKNLIILSDPVKHAETDTIRFMLPQLAALIKMDHAQLSARATIVLRLIMHHYAEFAISTIDSFTHRVIRTFAHDLKIPMNFEVELDAETMLSRAIDLLISQVGSEGKLTRIMVDFVEKKAGEELNWQIEKDLNEFGKTLLSESSVEAVGIIRNYDLETFINVQQSLMRWKKMWEMHLSGIANEISTCFDNEALVADSFIYKDKGVYSYLQNLSAGNFEKIRPNSYAEKALRNGEWINPKASAAQRDAFDRISGSVFPAGKQILEIIDNELHRYVLCRLLLQNLFATALLSEIEKVLNSLSEENNILLISEFNRRISAVVREQPAPFIYERLGEKYHHYLIDEFQDTSVMQWHNLLPLIENSLASGRMNMVVGDAKQAIYRWRSGDSEQFEKLPGLLYKTPDPLTLSREQALVSQYHEEELVSNHRSSPVIVDFNNRFFSFISGCMPDGFGNAFKHAGQNAAKKDKPGLVSIDKIISAENEDDQYEDGIHAKIIGIIREQQEDGYSYKDMAILCRKNAKAAKIASFLISQGVPVISSESLLLTQSGQVNFLVAWIRHLQNPSDTIPIAHILSYLIRKGELSGISFEDFFAKYPRSVAEGLAEVVSELFPTMNLKHLKRFEIFSLVQYLVFHFGLKNLNDSYLRFFQDALLEFVRTKKSGLADFLEWWEEKSKKLSVVIPEGINAVRIMTIHKAKGLQFPIVIYPFADDTLRSTRDNLWITLEEDYASPLKIACLPVAKSMMETAYGDLYEDEMNRSYSDLVNLLYVVLTRPEERLFVLLKDLPEKTDDPVTVPKLFSRFLKEEGKWEKDRLQYLYGERWFRTIQEPAEEETPPEGSFTCRPALNMLLRQHAPAVWDIRQPDRNREWGNLVHYIMSQVSGSRTFEEVLHTCSEDGLISPGQQEDLSQLIASIMNRPDIAELLGDSDNILNEPEILTEEGHIYRPDRLVFKDGMVTVIDFKTGRHHEDHRDQVINYTRLLRELNYQVKDAYLLYLNRQPELLRVV